MARSGSMTTEVGGAVSAAEDEPLEVVVVVAGGRRWGLMLRDVEEIHPVVSVTPLPGAPEGMEGVVDRRGAVVPVLDGCRRLGLASRPVKLSDRLVFVRAGRGSVALRVDAAVELVTLHPVDMHGDRSFVEESLRTAGIGRHREGLLVVLDSQKFLSSSEWATVEAALADLQQGPG